MKILFRQVELGLLFFFFFFVCQPFSTWSSSFSKRNFVVLFSWHDFTDRFQVTYRKMGSNKEVIKTQDVQNKGKFKHFPKHNLLWLLYFSEASFSLFSVGKLGHIDFANVIYWVNREVGLEPNIQTSPYMFCCFLLFVCLFFTLSGIASQRDVIWKR